MKTIIYKMKIWSAFAFLLVMTVSCGDDSKDAVIEMPLASFTVQIDSENGLKVKLTNASFKADSYAWDFGDDAGTSADENPTYTYTKSGTYTIKLTATNAGGTDVFTLTVTVAGVGPNLVAGGDMSTPTDWISKALWVNDDNATNDGFVDGTFAFLSGGDADGNVYRYNNHILYQEVSLVAGKTYRFNADVKSEGTTGTWLEVYFGNSAPLEAPEAGSDDYVVGGIQVFLKSFGDGENCSLTAIDGDINEVAANGCALSDEKRKLLQADGTFTVIAEDLTANGTIFLLFKGGAWDGDFQTGLFIDNVSVVEIL